MHRKNEVRTVRQPAQPVRDENGAGGRDMQYHLFPSAIGNGVSTPWTLNSVFSQTFQGKTQEVVYYLFISKAEEK